MARKIDGVLGVPQVSRNLNFYFPQELARGDGMVVPLRWNHDKSEAGIIGQSTLTWDEDRLQLTYKALVNNPEIEKLLETTKWQVSLGIKAGKEGEICHSPGKCFNAPMEISFKEMSIVPFDGAGIPASTLNLVEGRDFSLIDEVSRTFIECQACGKDLQEPLEPCPPGQHQINGKCVPIEAQHPSGCPPGQHLVDGKCVPIEGIIPSVTSNTSSEAYVKLMTDKITKEDTTVSVKTDNKDNPVAPAPATAQPAQVAQPATAPAPAIVEPQIPAPAATAPQVPEPVPAPKPATAATNTQVPVPITNVEVPCPPGCTKPGEPTAPASPPNGGPPNGESEIQKLVDAKVAEQIEKLQKEIKESYQTKASVEESNAVWTEEKADEHVALMAKVLEGQSISIKIDKDEFIKQHSARIKGTFDEAITTSGTIPGIDVGTQIVILSGGIKIKPIRQWVTVRKIKQGDDTVRFYTLDIPAFANITESPSTDITPATHTLSGIDVSANTVRGFRQNVLKSELERFPKDLLEKIRETARTRAIEDEASNILVTTAASDTQDFGANHLSFNDGTLIVDETDEDAEVEASATGIEAARQRLEEQGHNVDGGSLVLALTPRAIRQVTTDANLIRYVQVGSPGISRTGRIEMYFGIELFVTNTIRVANNSDRNIVFAKGKAFGLAVGRDIELEFDKNIVRQSVDIVATHRINSVVIDATAYVILSSKSD